MRKRGYREEKVVGAGMWKRGGGGLLDGWLDEVGGWMVGCVLYVGERTLRFFIILILFLSSLCSLQNSNTASPPSFTPSTQYHHPASFPPSTQYHHPTPAPDKKRHPQHFSTCIINSRPRYSPTHHPFLPIHPPLATLPLQTTPSPYPSHAQFLSARYPPPFPHTPALL